jgi:SAM-dependent methyltransferase
MQTTESPAWPDWRRMMAEYLKKNVYSTDHPCYRRWLWQSEEHQEHHTDRVIELLRRACGDLKGLRVLDLGCGTGLDSINLAQAGALVTGLDIDPERLAIARARARAANVRVSFVESLSHPACNEGPPFDALISIDVIEHIEHPISVYAPGLARLRTGGAVILATGNRWALPCIWADPHWKLFGVSVMPRWLAKWYVCRWRRVIREYDMWYFRGRGWLHDFLQKSGCRLVHDDVIARTDRLASPVNISGSPLRRAVSRLAKHWPLRGIIAWVYTLAFSRNWWMLAEKSA